MKIAIIIDGISDESRIVADKISNILESSFRLGIIGRFHLSDLLMWENHRGHISYEDWIKERLIDSGYKIAIIMPISDDFSFMEFDSIKAINTFADAFNNSGGITLIVSENIRDQSLKGNEKSMFKEMRKPIETAVCSIKGRVVHQAHLMDKIDPVIHFSYTIDMKEEKLNIIYKTNSTFLDFELDIGLIYDHFNVVNAAIFSLYSLLFDKKTEEEDAVLEYFQNHMLQEINKEINADCEIQDIFYIYESLKPVIRDFYLFKRSCEDE